MKFWRRKKKVKEKEKQEEPSEWFLENGSKFLEELIKDCNGISNSIRMFSSHQILKATDHFSTKCYLCDHFNAKNYYFGPDFNWYKGVIEGRSYLIKKFREETEYYNDIALSARVSNHSGFLKLIGCSLEFPFPVLMFEYPQCGALNPRGSVGSMEGPLLPWNVRLKIAKEVAIAVTYLHTAFPRIIIHRDINALNVFLDKNWKAKLTEFSNSVTLPEGKSWIKDRLVFGTRGYIDPGYADTGILTQYLDVFSFGIFMLVLLMGRPAFCESVGVHSRILPYAKDLQERGEPVEFGGDSSDLRPGQMNMFLELALRCCAERNEDRPKMILVAKEIKLIEHSLDC